MRSFQILVGCSAIAIMSPVALAQGGGGFGGGGGFSSGSASSQNGYWQQNRSDQAASFVNRTYLTQNPAVPLISVGGSAERRLTPEKLRLVIAMTVEAETAALCRDELNDLSAKIHKDWVGKLRIAKTDIKEDFIALLPTYDWTKARDGDAYRETQSGFRLQTNLHVAVDNDAQAVQAIDAAFAYGSVSVVTFDYWHSEIDRVRKEVMADALKAAKAKSGVLLDAFEERPRMVNVNEQTRVFFPNSLYQTYDNSLNRSLTRNSSRDIHAIKQKLTFLRGLQSDSDVRPQTMLMKPEIVVASHVTLYYQSPIEAKEKQ